MNYCINCKKETKDYGLRCYSCAAKKRWKCSEYKEKIKKKLSKALSGENHPLWGKYHSEKTKRKMRKAHKGLFTNSKHWNWQGGISRLPYNTERWNNDLKESIRQHDNHQCQFCGIKENGKKHSVHHIDYDKQNCNKENLITLCINHNIEANYNREKWQFCFEVLQEMRNI